MLYMVIENYKNNLEVYRRFDEKGRMMPDGLKYISSWIDKDVNKCFQLMETENEKLFSEWIANWSDIVDFEVVQVINSAEAREKITAQL